MAQLPGDPRVNQYSASAGQTTFVYDFKIYHDDEVTVQLNETTLTLTTDYTVTDAGEEAGGTIILVVAAVLNDVITLTGDTMVERDAIFSEGGDFSAAALNGEFNKVLNILSEGVTAFQRAVRLEVYSPTFDPQIQVTTARRALVVNAAGTAFEMTANDPDTQSGDAQAWAEAAEASADEAEVWKNDAYSYANDASSDADAAAQSAIDAAASAASIDLPHCASDIVPATTDIYNLGSPTHYWKQIYCYTGSFSSNVSVTGWLHATGNLNVGGTNFVADATTGDISCAGTITASGLATLDGGISVNHDSFSVSTSGIVVGANINKASFFQYIVAQGTHGGTQTSGDWRTRPINTIVYDGIGCTLDTSLITIPPGSYTGTLMYVTSQVNNHDWRILDLVSATNLAYGIGTTSPLGSSLNYVTCVPIFITSAGNMVIGIQDWSTSTVANTGMGQGGLVASGVSEVYLSLLLTKVA